MKQYNMDFGVTKSPAEILKEGAFGRKHFRKVFSRVNEKWFIDS